MNIREQAVACASACLLCLGPGIAAAQTGAQDPYDPQAEQHQQQQQHGMQQQHEDEGQRAERPQEQPAQEQEGWEEHEWEQQDQQQQQQAQQQPRQQQAQPSERQARGERGQDNLFASLDREQTRELQRQLQQEGYYDGEIDGRVGPLTRAAVREYQEQENLQASGQLDQETARALGIEVTDEVQPVAGTTGERPQQRARAQRDQNVRQAQQALSREGFHDGAIDGIMGPVTASSIREFQRAQGLRETGDLTPQTLEALGIRGQAQQQQAQQQPRQQQPQQQQGMQQQPQQQQGMQQPQEPQQPQGMQQQPQAEQEESEGSTMRFEFTE